MIKFKWETKFKKTEIGEIPRDWEINEIGEVITQIEKGKVPEKFPGIYPYLSVDYLRGNLNNTEFYDKKAGVFVTKDDILIIWDGVINAGEIFRGREGLLSSTMCRLEYDKVKIEREYFYHALKLLEPIIREARRGTDDRHVDKNMFLGLKIPYPPPEEQSRIATVLSWFDDLIENKKRQNEILEKVAMAIFKSWFVDFEPFEDEEFVYNEELGKEIPRGWEVEELGEFVSTQYGFTASGEETGKIKLLRIKDINKAFVIDWDSVPFCNIINDIFQKYQLKNMDIVISRIGDIGKVAIVENPPLSVFASYLIRLKIKNHKLTPYYLYYWLKAPDYQEYIQGAAEGSTRPNTNAEVIKAGPILIPPPSLIEKFEGVVFPIRSKIILNQKQIMVLRKIRDALLPKLVFGKLRVMEI